MKRGAPKSNPEKAAAFVARGRVSSAESLGRRRIEGTNAISNTPSKPSKRSGFTPASGAQRAKVKAARFALTGPAAGVMLEDLPLPYPVDPMHLTPRSKGGCDHPDCVIAAARESVHGPYDDGRLDLLTFFAQPKNRALYERELQHMLTHLSPVEMVEQLANDRVEWRGGREDAA